MKNCVICGKEFTPYYSRIQNTCSPKCEITKQGQKNVAKNKRKGDNKANKRKQEEAIYKVKRKRYLEENRICEACLKQATEIHHKKGRLGTMIYNELYFMAVCRTCHLYIENNPQEAKVKGWSVSRLSL